MPFDTTPLTSIDETARRRFEAAWSGGSPASIEQFLPPRSDPRYLATLEELVQIDLEWVWKRGSSRTGTTVLERRVEDYLARFPDLADPSVVRRLVRQEWIVRHRGGSPPDRAEYTARFPALAAGDEELQALLPPVAAPRPVPETFAPGSDGQAAPAHLPAIPGYAVISVLGKGGMGTVFLARQLGLDRLVAVKMIRGSVSGPEELARFRIEAEAVARLQHPNIVQIFEIGEWQPESGGPPLPYFTLEYVAGGSLSDHLDGRPQPARAAAQLMETLTRAVHAAHVQGIVHRDLKPANILLQDDGATTGHDADSSVTPAASFILRPTTFPKITDFGLARRLEDSSGHTQRGDVMGTPGYMAPEQASGEAHLAGPAADVYALGAILYELITGRAPFRGESMWDTVQQLLNEEPVPPRRLVPRVPRDLETIALKCLEKEALKRYPSAAELADDLGRFLRGEPINARPVGAVTRAGKWARRRPAAAALVALSVLIAISLLVAVAWNNARLRRQTKLETERAETAERQRQATQRERERAEANFKLAFEAVSSTIGHIRNAQLTGTPQGEQTVRALLEDAQRFCQAFLQQKSDDPVVRRYTALIHRLNGDIRSRLGRLDLAEKDYGAAIALHEELIANETSPQSPESRQDLASTLLNRARLRSERDQAKLAEGDYRRALEILHALFDEVPGDPARRRELASAADSFGSYYSDFGRYEDSREQFILALDLLAPLLADQPPTTRVLDAQARASTNLGLCHWHLRQFPEAVRHLEEAARVKRQLVTTLSQDPEQKFNLANIYNSLGLALSDAGKPREAEERFRDAIALQEPLAEVFSAVPAYHSELGGTLNNLANLLMERSAAGEARTRLELAVKHQQLALRSNPRNPVYRDFLANHLATLSDALLALGDYIHAAEAAEGLVQVRTGHVGDALDAATDVARCIALVEKDKTLSPQQVRQQSKAYTDQALRLLREAVRRGLNDAKVLTDNAALAPLVSSPEFQKLLAEMRAKK
jgi:serine/threonine protein kinase/tetratricopeptide (TPR) repeat protein